MKKFLTIILIIALILSITAILHPVNAESNWKVSATTNNEKITNETKQVIIQLKLDSYSGNGELGYQANLSYDKNIFQNVSINAKNDWDDIEYEASTGNFISTTKNAKEGTVIAEIILTLKDGLTSKFTAVSLNNVVFSDAEVETNFSKTFTYALRYDVQENPNQNNKPNLTLGISEIGEQKPHADTTENEKPTANNTNNPNASKNYLAQTSDITIKFDKVTKEDVTTVAEKLPQTGGVPTLVIIGIIAVFGIVCYIRYRTIQIK